MNEKQLKAFWLGLFIIASIILISWFLLFIRPTYGDGKQTLFVRFSNIEKVSLGTKVTYAGEAVGKVVEIREVFNARTLPSADSGYYFFELVLKIDSHVKVYDTDEIVLTTTGLLGEKSIAIIPCSNCGKGKEIVEHEVLYAQSSSGLQDQLGQLGKLTTSADQLFKTLNNFLVDNQNQLQKTFVSLEHATNQLDQFLQIVQQDKLSLHVADAAVHLTKAMDATFHMLDEVKDQNLIADLSSTSRHLSQITENIQNREGTLGKLIHDEELYLQMTAAFCQLRCLVEDIRNYGIFFHYNKQWQRRQKCLQSH